MNNSLCLTLFDYCLYKTANRRSYSLDPITNNLMLARLIEPPHVPSKKGYHCFREEALFVGPKSLRLTMFCFGPRERLRPFLDVPSLRTLLGLPKPTTIGKSFLWLLTPLSSYVSDSTTSPSSRKVSCSTTTSLFPDSTSSSI